MKFGLSPYFFALFTHDDLNGEKSIGVGGIFLKKRPKPTSTMKWWILKGRYVNRI